MGSIDAKILSIRIYTVPSELGSGDERLGGQHSARPEGGQRLHPSHVSPASHYLNTHTSVRKTNGIISILQRTGRVYSLSLIVGTKDYFFVCDAVKQVLRNATIAMFQYRKTFALWPPYKAVHGGINNNVELFFNTKHHKQVNVHIQGHRGGRGSAAACS